MLTNLLFAFQLLAAGDWPQWRGPLRDGVASGVEEPRAWPEKLQRKWSVPVGEGHSSPVVAGGRIYLHSRQGESEIAQCLRASDGAVVWKQSYPAPYKVNSAAAAHGKGVKSTPVLSGGKLYTLGIGGVLSCFDAETGRVEWRNDYQSSPHFGVAMSPAVYAGAVIVHVGAHDKGQITALDAATGEARWSWTGDGPAYASPVIAELDGVRQVITQTQKFIVGLAVSGELLWKIPFTTSYVQNSVTPLVVGQRLIVSGLNNGALALRVRKGGASWSTERLWRSDAASMYMNSPVASGLRLYAFTHKNKGQLICLDVESGQTLWTGPPRAGDNAALVLLGKSLLMLTEDAILTVVRLGDSFEPVRKYTVAQSATWAHPAPLGKGVLIKDAAALTLWTWE